MSTEIFRQSEQWFRTLIEHSTEAIALFSPDSTILYASPSTERVTGYTADEFVGMNSFSLVHPGDLEGVQARLASLLDQPGAFTTLQYRLRHQDGTFRWIEGIVSNRLADPSIGAIVSNYRDITRQKQTEAERDRALGMFTDITEQRRLEPSDLAAIVREVVEDQHVAATARVIELELPALETVPALADADRIGQVVSNYLSNAIKYAPADRPILVRLQVEGTNARLSVQDQGPGLSPVEQERIWDRFYRVPGVERQPGVGPSLGLGLYICHMIVEQHTGQVGVTSTPGYGSTFWFTLPLTAPDRVTPAAGSN